MTSCSHHHQIPRHLSSDENVQPRDICHFAFCRAQRLAYEHLTWWNFFCSKWKISDKMTASNIQIGIVIWGFGKARNHDKFRCQSQQGRHNLNLKRTNTTRHPLVLLYVQYIPIHLHFKSQVSTPSWHFLSFSTRWDAGRSTRRSIGNHQMRRCWLAGSHGSCSRYHDIFKNWKICQTSIWKNVRRSIFTILFKCQLGWAIFGCTVQPGLFSEIAGERLLFDGGLSKGNRCVHFHQLPNHKNSKNCHPSTHHPFMYEVCTPSQLSTYHLIKQGTTIPPFLRAVQPC